MLLASVGLLYYKRKLLSAHGNLFKKSFYLRLDEPAKKTHNGLQFGLLAMHLMNFVTFLIAFFFSSSQYLYGVRNRYFSRLDYERDL